MRKHRGMRIGRLHGLFVEISGIQRGTKKSGTSAYFCFYLRNALTKSNNFWHT